MKQINNLAGTKLLIKLLPFISNFFPDIILCKLIIFLSLKKESKTRSSNNHISAIVITTPGGDLDIFETLKFADRDFTFIFFPKLIFDLIYKLKQKSLKKDYETVTKINQNDKYAKFINCFLKILKKKFDTKIIIQFNFVYQSQHYLNFIAKKYEIKVCYYLKECFKTTGEWIGFVEKTRTLFRNVLPHSIFCVHNSETVEIIKKIDFLSKPQIFLVGQARSSFLINRMTNNMNMPIKKILFFMIAPKAGLPKFSVIESRVFNKDLINYLTETNLSIYNRPIYELIYNICYELYGIKDITLKTKQALVDFDVNKPTKIIGGGPRLDLVDSSTLAIGCNSTSLIECSILGAKCINFTPIDQNVKLSKDFFFNLPSPIMNIKNLKDLENSLVSILNNSVSKFNKEELNQTIEKYLFNLDGKAGERFWNKLTSL